MTAMARAGVAVLVLGLLSACQTTGLSARDDEIDRQQVQKGFKILSQSPGRIVVSARGRKVAAEPADGYCIDAAATEVTSNSAFMLISDCFAAVTVTGVDSASGAGSGDGDDADLDDRKGDPSMPAPRPAKAGDPPSQTITAPPAFPGILTITVSGARALGTGSGALDEFEALLSSTEGKALLGRGNTGSNGLVVATRRSGGAFYALVEEPAGATPIFAPRFWRGFIDINQRLVLVTVSCFSDRPVADDLMLSFLATQIARLRKANGMPEVPDEQKITALFRLDAGGATVRRSFTDDAPAIETADAAAPVVLAAASAPAAVLVPASRSATLRAVPRPVVREADQVAASEQPLAQGSSVAPEQAPLAPRRPG